MGSVISFFAPLLIKIFDYWIEKKLNDAEVFYRWTMFKKAMDQKGFISGHLNDDYERQLKELEKRRFDS